MVLNETTLKPLRPQRYAISKSAEHLLHRSNKIYKRSHLTPCPERQKISNAQWKPKRANESPSVPLALGDARLARGERSPKKQTLPELTYPSAGRVGTYQLVEHGLNKTRWKRQDAARRDPPLLALVLVRSAAVVAYVRLVLALYRGTIDTYRQHRQLVAPWTKPSQPTNPLCVLAIIATANHPIHGIHFISSPSCIRCPWTH